MSLIVISISILKASCRVIQIASDCVKSAAKNSVIITVEMTRRPLYHL